MSEKVCMRSVQYTNICKMAKKVIFAGVDAVLKLAISYESVHGSSWK